MTVIITTVSNNAQKRDFVAVPWHIHATDKLWVPPLRYTIKKILDTKKHPFYQHAELMLWVAYDNGQPIGRIAGIFNHKHNEFHDEAVIFWGFFDSINCQTTANALFAAVELWARQKKAKALRGPVSPSMNYECGMQVSAFTTKPFLMMSQNPPYYPELVALAGHHKVMDMHAWLIDLATVTIPPRLNTIKQKLLKNKTIAIRAIDMSNYHQDIKLFLDIFNDAWQDNWGFVPMTSAEALLLAKEMKSIIIPKLAYIITVNDEPAACAICLPNINQVLHSIRNGKLLPTGLFKLMWYLKKPRKAQQGRIPLLGVKKKFRHLPLGALLYAQYGEVREQSRMTVVECSWILETNKSMNFILKYLKAQPYKIYRIYEKLLPGWCNEQ